MPTRRAHPIRPRPMSGLLHNQEERLMTTVCCPGCSSMRAPIPAVQLLGSAVLLRGPAVLHVQRLVEVGIRETHRRDGIRPSLGLVDVLQALTTAADALRMSGSGHDDVARGDDSAQSEMTAPIGTREAAVLLGITPRQTQRIARSLGGHRAPGGAWTFARDEVEAYANYRMEKQA
ncbi:MAG: hypothetical protein JWO98_1058 [Frankiales bacterium]|nr:hypothetical protein [Frankiales bacterium]